VNGVVEAVVLHLEVRSQNSTGGTEESQEKIGLEGRWPAQIRAGHHTNINQKRCRVSQAARFDNIAQVKRYRRKFHQIKKLKFTHAH
jgi:hypothetical protein